ncbi:MAG: DUF177 domain-containing protein [Armatimonadetes bacterium]|nr:DUF177 domain-containing protein [Armatimonadota bacterium]
MKLEIAEIINNVGQQGTAPIEQPCPPDADLECIEPVRGTLRLTNTGRYLLVQGELRTIVQVDCSRCLKQVQVPLAAPIEEEFPLPVMDERGVVHWETDEDAGAPILHDYLLDVDELARQHLSLALPTAPVCDAACRGLCPGCGENLNEGPCTCRPETVDPRLAGLRALLDEGDRE